MFFVDHRHDVETALSRIDPDQVTLAVEVLRFTRIRRGSVYIMGNGGSAATASHLANDLLKACGMKAYSLPDMTPTLTAFGNDCGWEEMYSQLLTTLLSPTDVVIAISCSGNSPNVVDPVHSVKYHPFSKISTIALIGDNLDCALAQECPDVLISVPFPDIKVQEDCHMVICHSIIRTLCNAPTTPQGVL